MAHSDWLIKPLCSEICLSFLQRPGGRYSTYFLTARGSWQFIHRCMCVFVCMCEFVCGNKNWGFLNQHLKPLWLPFYCIFICLTPPCVSCEYLALTFSNCFLGRCGTKGCVCMKHGLNGAWFVPCPVTVQLKLGIIAETGCVPPTFAQVSRRDTCWCLKGHGGILKQWNSKTT